MNNIEMLEDEICCIEGELGSIADEMMERYGRFLTLEDSDRNGGHQSELVSRYDALTRRKEHLIDCLSALD